MNLLAATIHQNLLARCGREDAMSQLRHSAAALRVRCFQRGLAVVIAFAAVPEIPLVSDFSHELCTTSRNNNETLDLELPIWENCEKYETG